MSITSIYDVTQNLSVDEMLLDPTFIPEKFKETLIEGQEETKLFFRPTTAKGNAVAWNDQAAPDLDQDYGPVAEFAEIPVGATTNGKSHVKTIDKFAVGLRVSWEMRRDDDRGAVANMLLARRNAVLRGDARDALAAINEAEVQELAVGTAWNKGGKVAGDLLDAQELIRGAEDENGRYYTYEPNLLWIHPSTYSAVLRNPEMQSLYVGNMASEHPLFKGLANETLFGDMRVVTSHAVPKDTAYVAMEGVAGFCAEQEARIYTPFYAERGETATGGATMSFRSDVIHRRAFGVDNPKSIVKLTGLVA